jgi:hypothetical protein
MLTVSVCDSSEKSVVALSRPAPRSAPTSAVGTSGMYERPALISSTLRVSMSKPTAS